MLISNRFEKHMVAAAAVALSAAAANAAIVTWNADLIIPNTVDGRYVNVETQVYGSAAGVVAGWDINPYGTSTSTMSWYIEAPNGCVMGYGQSGTLDGVASLPGGTLVGAASTFGAASDFGNPKSSVIYGGWMLNAANYFGFRFIAADGLTHYGYGIMTVGADFSVRTLTSVFYESDAGVGITVVSVPAPGALALLGLAGIATRRRRC